MPETTRSLETKINKLERRIAKLEAALKVSARGVIIKSEKKLTLDANDVVIKSGRNLDVSAAASIDMKSDSLIEVNGGANLKLNAGIVHIN